VNNIADQQSRIFGRSFPLGYLLHGHPLRGHHTHDYDSSSESCGQFLFSLVLLRGFYRSHRSHMKTGLTGLEIYWHPNYTIQVSWQEVLRFERKKYFGVIPYEVLYVDRPIYPKELPVIYLSKSIKERVEKMRLGIPLRCYQGWPHGDLERELQKYIPQIMKHPA
jgi:hypothetical protein